VVDLLLALFLTASPVRPLSPPRVDTLSASDGSRAALVVPFRRNPSRSKLPLVVWFHGGIGANNPSKGLAAAAGFVSWADSGGFALLAPSAWPASPWWSATAQARLAELVERAGKVPGVDASRLVLAGVSDGGSGALWLAGRMRPLWGAKLCGVAVWSTDPSVLASQGVSLDPAPLSGLPVRWTAGGRDRLYPFEDVERWWGLLGPAGVKLETRHDPLADHDLSFHRDDLARFPAWVRGRTVR